MEEDDSLTIVGKTLQETAGSGEVTQLLHRWQTGEGEAHAGRGPRHHG